MEQSVTTKGYISSEGYSVKILSLAIETCLEHGIERETRFKSAARWLLGRDLSKLDLLLIKLSKICHNESISVLLHTVTTNQQNSHRWREQSVECSLNDNEIAQKRKTCWVRHALVNNYLYDVVKCLIEHSSNLYESNALLRDAVSAQLLISLIAGPCILVYANDTNRFSPLLTNEPDARELLQRQSLTITNEHEPASTMKRSMSLDKKRQPSLHFVMKSLYQNNSDKILFAKNNVKIEHRPEITKTGHLSLIRNRSGAVVQFIPNIFMQMGNTTAHSLINGNDGIISTELSKISHIYIRQGCTIMLIEKSGKRFPSFCFETQSSSVWFMEAVENCLVNAGGRLIKHTASYPTCMDADDLSTSCIYRVISPSIFQTLNSPPYCALRTPKSPIGDKTFFFGHSFSPRQTNLSNSLVSDTVARLSKQIELELLVTLFNGWRRFAQKSKRLKTLISTLIRSDEYKLNTQPHADFDKCTDNTLDLFSYIYLNGLPEHADKKEIWPILLGNHRLNEHELLFADSERKVYFRDEIEWIKAILPETTLFCSNEQSSCVIDNESANECIKALKRVSFDELPAVMTKENIQFHYDTNLIDKDVLRCDRMIDFFKKTENLDKMRRILCTYTWKHSSLGYIQGMCDILAPLLLTLTDESLTYSCFCRTMDRLNFDALETNTNSMNRQFETLEMLVEWLDADLFEHIQSISGEQTSYYFSYRWLLLDFKREFKYDDVFRIWEHLWSAEKIVCSNYRIFIAAALITEYRNVIIDNLMDIPEILRFFNDMSEKHDCGLVLHRARNIFHKLLTESLKKSQQRQ